MHHLFRPFLCWGCPPHSKHVPTTMQPNLSPQCAEGDAEDAKLWDVFLPAAERSDWKLPRKYHRAKKWQPALEIFFNRPKGRDAEGLFLSSIKVPFIIPLNHLVDKMSADSGKKFHNFPEAKIMSSSKSAALLGGAKFNSKKICTWTNGDALLPPPAS